MIDSERDRERQRGWEEGMGGGGEGADRRTVRQTDTLTNIDRQGHRKKTRREKRKMRETWI